MKLGLGPSTGWSRGWVGLPYVQEPGPKALSWQSPPSAGPILLAWPLQRRTHPPPQEHWGPPPRLGGRLSPG